MRLIDADELIKWCTYCADDDIVRVNRQVMIYMLENAPTVEAVPVAELPYTVWLTHDVVQVVRCKDCKWQELCKKTLEYKGADGYCSKGERSN